MALLGLMGLRLGIRRLTALVTTIGFFTTLLFMGAPFYVGDATTISYDNGQQQQQQQQQESRHHRYLLMATAGGKLNYCYTVHLFGVSLYSMHLASCCSITFLLLLWDR